jgi:hypothetical protein
LSPGFFQKPETFFKKKTVFGAKPNTGNPQIFPPDTQSAASSKKEKKIHRFLMHLNSDYTFGVS